MPAPPRSRDSLEGSLPSAGPCRSHQPTVLGGQSLRPSHIRWSPVRANRLPFPLRWPTRSVVTPLLDHPPASNGRSCMRLALPLPASTLPLNITRTPRRVSSCESFWHRRKSLTKRSSLAFRLRMIIKRARMLVQDVRKRSRNVPVFRPKPRKSPARFSRMRTGRSTVNGMIELTGNPPGSPLPSSHPRVYQTRRLLPILLPNGSRAAWQHPELVPDGSRAIVK